jgi:hypothetical protein
MLGSAKIGGQGDEVEEVEDPPGFKQPTAKFVTLSARFHGHIADT